MEEAQNKQLINSLELMLSFNNYLLGAYDVLGFMRSRNRTMN